jgi:methionyl aminopeptidase
MIVTNEEEILTLREGGRRLGTILREVAKKALQGVTSAELDTLATKLIRGGGDEPAFLDYTPQGAKRPFPAALCVSINNEVVHGIPNEAPRTLKEGDIVALDLGLTHEGLTVDAAITVGVGSIDDVAAKLIRATKSALDAGIRAARAGNTTGDISAAIGASVEEAGFVPANELGGHGVGKSVHEEPYIPNSGIAGTGTTLVEGMALALEPIVNEGTANIQVKPDGYTIVTRDGKRSAHFEHTILVTKAGAEILTKP